MARRSHRTVLCLVALTLALSGCATVLNNKDPEVEIISDPPAAEVYVDGNYYGRAPVRVDMTVRNDHVVVLRKEGYYDRTEQVTRFVGFGWIVLDILTGLVPLIIDMATGDWNMLETETLVVAMEKTEGASAEE